MLVLKSLASLRLLSTNSDGSQIAEVSLGWASKKSLPLTGAATPSPICMAPKPGRRKL